MLSNYNKTSRVSFFSETSGKCYKVDAVPHCCSLGQGCEPWTYSTGKNRRISLGGSKFTDHYMDTRTKIKIDIFYILHISIYIFNSIIYFLNKSSLIKQMTFDYIL